MVNNIFPDFRNTSYEGAAPIEEDSIGNFTPHLKEVIISDNVAQMEKHFNSTDYSEFAVQDVVSPAVDYNRTLFIDTNSGVVLGGDAEYEYKLG